MCTLVGDNKTEGLIVSRLRAHSRVHLIVAVKEALVFLPISCRVRIANYQVSWKLVLDKDHFIMTDGWVTGSASAECTETIILLTFLVWLSSTFQLASQVCSSSLHKLPGGVEGDVSL